MPLLSIVSPVCNEEACLNALYERLRSALSQLTDDYEIVLVDDGSRDRSWALMRELAACDARVRPLRLSRNFGHHQAITAGLDHATGEWVVIMDSDLQDDPAEIPKLFRKAQEGFDIVVGLRVERKHSWTKRLGAALFYRALKWLGDIEYDGRGGVFQVLSRRVVNTVCAMREDGRFVPGLVTWSGFDRAAVPVTHQPRFAGTTNYTLRRQWALAIRTILSFSDRPLRLASQFGLLIAGSSLLYGLYIVLKAVRGEIEVLGYASIVASVLFVGGLTISTVGLVGIYVGAIYRQSQGRPLYVVAEGLNVVAPLWPRDRLPKEVALWKAAERGAPPRRAEGELVGDSEGQP